MKKPLLFLSITLFCRIVLTAQTVTTDSTLVQSQYFDDGKSVSLIADSGWSRSTYNAPQLSLRFSDVNGTKLASVPLNFLDTSLTGNNLTEININFIDPDNGFIYGYETGYGYLTFLFRTADAGKTWSRIALNGIGYESQLSRNDLFMFNDKQGIIISLGGFPVEFHYYITTDGGKTWSDHSYALPGKDMMLSYGEDHLKPSFSADGKVTVMIVDPINYNSHTTTTIVLQSSNFGESFHEMK